MGFFAILLLLLLRTCSTPHASFLFRSNTLSPACRTLATAEKLVNNVELARAISLDVSSESALDAALADHDLVISLIPYSHHATVIESAIRTKTNVVTTSYVSPAMQALDQRCRDAGITVMNEMGVDPGLDHLYAVKTIHEVHEAGGKILSFLSYCGGLPAPENSDNPLGYKFSWSARGVLQVMANQASFLQDGKQVTIEGKDLMAAARPYFIYPGFSFIAYPNRDSTPYAERYNIPEASTIIRGTLRYQGFPQFARTLVDLGFITDTPVDALKEAAAANRQMPWCEVTAAVVGAASSSAEDLTTAIQKKTKFSSDEEADRILAGLRWIGMYSSDKITIRGNGSPLDTLCGVLEPMMAYEEGERDMIMLQHKFEIEHANGSLETRTSTIVEYGVPGGYSAMAKLVGVPCAVTVLQVLNGKLSQKGVLAPMSWDVVQPLLEELDQKYGIRLSEKTVA